MYIHTYIHTYIRVFCIAHINSIESLCASKSVVDVLFKNYLASTKHVLKGFTVTFAHVCFAFCATISVTDVYVIL